MYDALKAEIDELRRDGLQVDILHDTGPSAKLRVKTQEGHMMAVEWSPTEAFTCNRCQFDSLHALVFNHSRAYRERFVASVEAKLKQFVSE